MQEFFLIFERVHPIVFILMYWIYLIPSTQQTIGYNGFITCFDSHESSSGYVQNLSVLAVLLLTVYAKKFNPKGSTMNKTKCQTATLFMRSNLLATTKHEGSEFLEVTPR
jgi:hypothetical protein